MMKQGMKQCMKSGVGALCRIVGLVGISISLIACGSNQTKKVTLQESNEMSTTMDSMEEPLQNEEYVVLSIDNPYQECMDLNPHSYVYDNLSGQVVTFDGNGKIQASIFLDEKYPIEFFEQNFLPDTGLDGIEINFEGIFHDQFLFWYEAGILDGYDRINESIEFGLVLVDTDTNQIQKIFDTESFFYVKLYKDDILVQFFDAPNRIIHFNEENNQFEQKEDLIYEALSPYVTDAKSFFYISDYYEQMNAFGNICGIQDNEVMLLYSDGTRELIPLKDNDGCETILHRDLDYMIYKGRDREFYCVSFGKQPYSLATEEDQVYIMDSRFVTEEMIEFEDQGIEENELYDSYISFVGFIENKAIFAKYWGYHYYHDNVELFLYDPLTGNSECVYEISYSGAVYGNDNYSFQVLNDQLYFLNIENGISKWYVASMNNGTFEVSSLDVINEVLFYSSFGKVESVEKVLFCDQCDDPSVLLFYDDFQVDERSGFSYTEKINDGLKRNMEQRLSQYADSCQAVEHACITNEYYDLFVFTAFIQHVTIQIYDMGFLNQNYYYITYKGQYSCYKNGSLEFFLNQCLFDLRSGELISLTETYGLSEEFVREKIASATRQYFEDNNNSIYDSIIYSELSEGELDEIYQKAYKIGIEQGIFFAEEGVYIAYESHSIYPTEYENFKILIPYSELGIVLN